MRLRLFFLLPLLFICFFTHAVLVDTIQVKSKVMNKNIFCVVISPDKQINGASCPVLYLLHGYGGSYKSWLEVKPELPQLAEQYGMMIVCPDGENSWYWDSPQNSASQFETFISDELIKYIDQNYPTVPNAAGRAITGLSMGGHGALWLAIRHQDIFGGAGSTSGGLDILPFSKNWKIKEQLGEQLSNKQIWESHTVINQLEKLRNGNLMIIIDCGDNDIFFEVNNRVHHKLCTLNIKHDYIVRPGTHNSQYWNNSIEYQILFFAKFFNNKLI